MLQLGQVTVWTQSPRASHQLTTVPKVGPSLEKVASKVTREWATRWVMKPDSFRASTKMPQFFYLENFVDVSGPRAPTTAQKHMNEQGRRYASDPRNQERARSLLARLRRR